MKVTESYDPANGTHTYRVQSEKYPDIRVSRTCSALELGIFVGGPGKLVGEFYREAAAHIHQEEMLREQGTLMDKYSARVPKLKDDAVAALKKTWSDLMAVGRTQASKEALRQQMPQQQQAAFVQLHSKGPFVMWPVHTGYNSPPPEPFHPAPAPSPTVFKVKVPPPKPEPTFEEQLAELNPWVDK